MSEVLRGAPDQLAAWRVQAENLYAIGSLVVIGSFARAAMYESAGWPVPSMSVEQHSRLHPFELQPRDIDVVFPFSTAEPLSDAHTGPHPLDEKLHNQLFNHPGGYRFGTPEQNFPVDPEVFATRVRRLAGANVRTFTYGTQIFLNDVFGAGGMKYRISKERFSKFAAAMRESQPDEFLPDEAYQPFRLFSGQAD